MNNLNIEQLTEDIHNWSSELGFQQLTISNVDLGEYQPLLESWLKNDYHGDMHYMAKHGEMRSHPEQLLPGTVKIISVRMDYSLDQKNSLEPLKNTSKAYIARYARGRDYHKLMRNRLQKLANKIQTATGSFGYRAFVDSAPVLERALAEKSGMGWIGKNTMLINKKAGSWFFLGELFTDLPLLETLAGDEPIQKHCGSCTACLDICPTQAFVAANTLDARRCISYLTIELRTSIPIELRPLMGNRIFGCDDCQLICPWNKFTQKTGEQDFSPRHQLDDCDLLSLFDWSEAEFYQNTAGSPIRRIGYECWLRNIAVALGNAQKSDAIEFALQEKQNHSSELVREHVQWALLQHTQKG
ncbi:MAG: tRNA epoxyqueuosine(34) reductase QueG [SAR86 cluster bacterium]|uniref:Epoxyqueuosine reductase n=1 Tax=SAR86 cluster bacterium TaxID=2030880 RepID=A0A2A4MT57_9GAMM|nr:MAG: tRNA epoxyqueuosine(34) reductase QueG [SAR86 cluster bacterium]